jgi:hypothetical protein
VGSSAGQDRWDAKGFADAIQAGGDRFSLMDQLVKDWYPPIAPSELIPTTELQSAEQRLGRKLPESLHRWFAIIGRRPSLRCGLCGNGDWVQMPDELKMSKEGLDLIHETQGVWKIAIRDEDLNLPDPPVWSYDREEYDLWSGGLLNPSLSSFALQWALYSIKFDGPFAATTLDHEADLSRLVDQLIPLPFPVWHIWGKENGLLYHVADDLVVEIQDLETNHTATAIWLAARTETARSRTLALVDCDWNLWKDV